MTEQPCRHCGTLLTDQPTATPYCDGPACFAALLINYWAWRDMVHEDLLGAEGAD